MKTQDTTAMAFLAGEALAASVAGQAAGLNLLFSEMQALTNAMPGLAHPGVHLTDAQQAARDAEVESEFDNMPV